MPSALPASARLPWFAISSASSPVTTTRSGRTPIASSSRRLSGRSRRAMRASRGSTSDMRRRSAPADTGPMPWPNAAVVTPQSAANSNVSRTPFAFSANASVKTPAPLMITRSARFTACTYVSAAKQSRRNATRRLPPITAASVAGHRRRMRSWKALKRSRNRGGNRRSARPSHRSVRNAIRPASGTGLTPGQCDASAGGELVTAAIDAPGQSSRSRETAACSIATSPRFSA